MMATACTEHGQAINEHAPSVKTAPPPSTLEDPGPAGPTRDEAIQKFDSSTDPLKEILAPLAARVLDVNTISNTESLIKRQVQDDLINLNSLILRLPNESYARPEFVSLMNQYVEALNSDCGEIRDSCVGLKYFKLAGNSSPVVRLLATLRKAEAPRLLLWAVELKNRQPDLELLKLIVIHLPAALNSADTAMKKALTSYLDTALQMARKSIQNPKELRQLLQDIDAWSLARGRGWKLSPGGAQALWYMLARSGLMYGEDGKPDVNFQQLIQEANQDKDSLYNKQLKLKQAKFFHPEAVGATYIENYDDLFYLIDSVYMKRMTSNGASELYQATGRDPEDLVKVMENYVHLQFAYGLYSTTLMAKEIFTAKVPTNQLLLYVLPQSARVKQIWGRVQEPVMTLTTFMQQALVAKGARPALERQSTSFLESFTRSVTFASVYPHTLLLFHYLSQQNFTLSLLNAGELSSSKIMVLAFHGFFLPLLKYAENGTQLNNVEILYAFDSAIRSGLFPAVGLNPDLFISDTLMRLTEDHRKVIEFNLDRVAQRIAQNPHVSDMTSTCAGLTSGYFQPRTIEFAELKVSPYFGQFAHDMTRPVNDLSGSTASAANTNVDTKVQGIFYADYEYIEALERARLDLGQQLRAGEIMLKSYTDYMWRYQKLPGAEIGRRTAKTRIQLQRIRELRKRALNETRHWQKTLGTCYYKAAFKEWEFTESIIGLEEEYLRQVHHDMVELRMDNLTFARRTEIMNSYRLHGLPGGFSGLDRIDGTGYGLNQADFLVRVSRYVPKLAPHLSINMGSKLTNDNPLIRSGEFAFLPFVDSEEEFVVSGLRALFRPEGQISRYQFANWFSLLGKRSFPWPYYIRTLESTYRMETELSPTERSVTAEDILHAHEDVLKVISYSPRTREIMTKLKMAERIEIAGFSGKLIEYPYIQGLGRPVLQAVWGLYDMPVLFMNREKLGNEVENEKVDVPIKTLLRPYRFGYLELGRTYYKARAPESRGTLMVSDNPVLDHYMDRVVGEFVGNELKSIQDFQSETQAYLKTVAALPAEQKPRADITMTLQIVDPLLRNSLVESFNSDTKLFHRDTQNCFIQKCDSFN